MGVFLFLAIVALLYPLPLSSEEQRPHWVPAGSVPEALERNVLQQRTYLQNRSREAQIMGLDWIEEDIRRFPAGEMRIAAVPLVVDMLDRDFRILTVTPGYRVDPGTRIRALSLLARIGGEEARSQLRHSTVQDSDSAVRVTAAGLLAGIPGQNPEADLLAISRALRAGIERGLPEAEVIRLLAAVWEVSRHVWSVNDRDLFDTLIRIHSGPYSRSTRETAFSMLEEFARR